MIIYFFAVNLFIFGRIIFFFDVKLRMIKIGNIKHSNSGDKIFIFCLWSPCQGMAIKL